MTLIFDKIKKENIFCDEFVDFKQNNVIEFSKQGIAIIYGPNGTGKTSFAKVLNSENNSEYTVHFNGDVYNHEKNKLFHIINDQNGRNLIAGETKEFLLGDDIRKEYDLKDYLNIEFSKLFEDVLISTLKSVFGISKKSSKFLKKITDEYIVKYIVDLANSQSKGKKLDRYEFVSYVGGLSECKLPLYEEDKLSFLIHDFEDANSIVAKILEIKNEEIVKSEHITDVEEHEDAIKVLQKFSYKNECIVCDNDINPVELLSKKEINKKKIYSELNDKTKKILEGIISIIIGKDPFNIKETLLVALKNGDFKLVDDLKEQLQFYFQVYNLKIINFFSKCLKDTDLIQKSKEYKEVIEKKPELMDEDVLFIENIVNENIERKIELKRDINNNLKLVMDDKEFLNKDRQALQLSNGEQNFISLSFELLKAKNSDKDIIILDDPISSFDSIYKNKIAFSIIKFLESKKQIILTHNTELIKLMEHQVQKSFNLYLFNNTHNEENGFIPVNTNEQEILLYIDKLLNLFRNDIFNQIEDEKNYLLSMIPFMRGYAQITDNINSKNELTKLMHGYSTEKVNVTDIYNNMFDKKGTINTPYEISADDISLIDLEKVSILVKNTEYPLLDRTLKHTMAYLYLRLNVEKTLVSKFNINTKKHDMLSSIIFSSFKGDDLDNKKKRIFLASRKTLLNEFNHFEGNMNIFQPAIDITNTALKKEKNDIIQFLNSL